MKAPHWYLRNWEYEARMGKNGQVRSELVYKGEYYRLAPSAMAPGRLKGLYFVLAMLLCLDLALLLTHFSRGACLFFVGGAAGITLIPTIYLVIGSVQALRTPEKMTYRDLRASFLRIRMASKWILGMMALCLAGEIVFLIFRLTHGLAIDWPGELLWLIGGGVGVAIGGGNLLLYAHNRIDLLPKEQ